VGLCGACHSLLPFADRALTVLDDFIPETNAHLTLVRDDLVFVFKKDVPVRTVALLLLYVTDLYLSVLLHLGVRSPSLVCCRGSLAGGRERPTTCTAYSPPSTSRNCPKVQCNARQHTERVYFGTVCHRMLYLGFHPLLTTPVCSVQYPLENR